MGRHLRLIGCLALLVSGGFEHLIASEPPHSRGAVPGSTLQQTPLSVEMRYGLLFRTVMRFKTHALLLDQAGKPSRFVSEHYQEQLQLSDEAYGVFLGIAERCSLDIDRMDREADALIKNTKLQFRNQPRLTNTALPPPPKELTLLEQSRRSTILSSIVELEAAIGPAQFALLDAAVNRLMGQHYQSELVK